MKGKFKFKQFEISHHRSAMKVGTDGVLLGAWASVSPTTNNILDIGAGSGLIALMLAQRCSAQTIDALEIDGDSYEECVDNFEASPWADRLFCYHADFVEFLEEIPQRYELVVSNPPYFKETVSSGGVARDRARQNSFLPFDLLLAGVRKLLSAEGLFATIIPSTSEESFLEIATSKGLFPLRITRVRGMLGGPVKRSLIELSSHSAKLIVNELTIEIARHQYTEEYRKLTADFYL